MEGVDVKFRVETSATLYMFNHDGILTDKEMRESAKDDFDYPKPAQFIPKHDNIGDVDNLQPQYRKTPDEMNLLWGELLEQIRNPWMGLN